MTASTASKTAKTTTAKPPAKPKAAPDPAWTAIPAAPKVPNYWQGYGYTLAYVNKGGGWDVHEGTHDSKATLADSEVLFHSRLAADAKQWVKDHAKPGTPKPAEAKAAKPTAKPKADAPKYSAAVVAMLRAVREHAQAHYDEGAWSEITEATSDEQLAEIIGKARSNRGAIANVEAHVKLRSDQQAGIDAQVDG